ncbi:MAG: recombinase family protein [Candidatus Nomurabacteria bacterium]|nr:recombinase family protein [Candidatus Nomurabacteria bacterium]
MKKETKTTQNKVVIYCRVSSKEQEDTGYSLPAQEKLLKEYAERKGLSILKVFSVAESASGTKQRKIFGEMMEYMQKKNIQILLCEKVDRLTRNLKEAVVANDWVEANEERQIHFVKQNLVIHKNAKSDEKFRWDIEIVLAKKYISNLSEEVRKGQKEKIAQGWLPTKPPIGYKTIGEKGHKIHIIDNEISPLIKKMFELYATGNYSLVSLEDEMHKLGLRTKNRGKIYQSRIYDLLLDPFYCGKMRWDGIVYPAKQEPLISKDLFDKVGIILKRRGKTSLATQHNYLFRSKVFCEGCGGVLAWESQKGTIYGHCNNHMKSRNCPLKTYVKEKDVEEQIDVVFEQIAPRNEAVLKWIEEIIKEENGEQINFRETEIQRLNGLLQSIRKQKDRYFEAKIDGEIDLEFCDRKISECRSEEAVLESALEKVNSQTDDYQDLSLVIHELAFKAREIYQKATVDEKKMLLSQLFTNFTQNRYEIRANYSLACDYLLKWMPKLNELYELNNSHTTKGKKSTFVLSHPTMLPLYHKIRTFFAENPNEEF